MGEKCGRYSEEVGTISVADTLSKPSYLRKNGAQAMLGLRNGV